jgi:uncharacterized protein (DUF1800 family)
VSLTERTALARLVHRVGFGPKPGQFQSMLAKGFDAAAGELLYAPRPAYGDVKASLGIADLGPQPPSNSAGIVAYADNKRNQLRAMTLWWLDQMVVQDHPFHERMTWFWHGHWATSYIKVDEPVVMFDHIDKLRQHAVGNFSQMCEQMVLDGALMYWLDGQLNTSTAPNENLARELMELFILGVNRYSEQDVKEAATVLSGWKVVKHSGLVYQNPRQSFWGSSTVLGVSDRFDAVKLARFLAEQSAAQRFIPERLWYRFASSETALPADSNVESMFAGREILPAMSSLAYRMAYADASHAVVKSPLEWLVGLLRALQITPSTYGNPDYLLSRLTNLGQRPLYPPNVGGWPADEAWLSVASAQTRIFTAQTLVSRADLSPVASVAPASRLDALADWLGVARWSARTRAALEHAASDARRQVTLALCSPEYVVSA